MVPQDNNMQDSPERREARRRPMNRKMRRLEAKKYKLFKDKSKYAWRKANAHMKGKDDA